MSPIAPRRIIPLPTWPQHGFPFSLQESLLVQARPQNLSMVGSPRVWPYRRLQRKFVPGRCHSNEISHSSFGNLSQSSARKYICKWVELAFARPDEASSADSQSKSSAQSGGHEIVTTIDHRPSWSRACCWVNAGASHGQTNPFSCLCLKHTCHRKCSAAIGQPRCGIRVSDCRSRSRDTLLGQALAHRFPRRVNPRRDQHNKKSKEHFRKPACRRTILSAPGNGTK